MANRPKQQGTRRERLLVERLTERGFDAVRAPNNSAMRDVDVRINGTLIPVEVKDRQSLRVHQLVLDMIKKHRTPMFAVYWHRYEQRKKGQTRRTSLGSVWVVPEEMMESLLEHARETGWSL